MACVLIAEDEEQVRVLAENILQEAGHETRSARNAAEALALLEAGEPADLLFTDINLEENSPTGLDLAADAVQARPGLRVLYASAGGLTDGTRALFVDGAAFLRKPYTVDQLTQAVAAVLEDG